MALPTQLDTRPKIQIQQPAPLKTEPEFGDPGYRKGQPNPRRGTPRARITELDAKILAFVGKFPGADAEALSILNFKQASPTSPAGNGFPSIHAIESRIRKLKKLGTIESYRHAGTGVTSYSLTKEGFGYARDYGYQMDGGRTLSGISVERLNHYRIIAHVAAQLTSPGAFFEQNLGISPVELSALVSENEMRASFQPAKNFLKDQKAAGKPNDFAKLRSHRIGQAFKAAESGSYSWSELVERNPVLFTVGQAAKSVYQPDLAVNLDRTNRRDQWGHNLIVEVELSKKSRDAYESILRTIKAETESAPVYSQAVYFTIGNGVGKILREIDKQHELGLFASNRLVVLPVLHRDGTPLQLHKRIVL